jgi:hypothetical protein
MKFFELRRYRDVGCVALSLLVVFCPVAYLSSRLAGHFDFLYPRDPTMLQGQYRLLGSRVAGIKQPVGLILGSSTVKFAFDEARLREATGYRWLNFGGAGANVEDVERLLALIDSAGIQTEAIVLGLHPDMVCETKSFLSQRGVYGYRPTARTAERISLSLMRPVTFVEDYFLPDAARVNYRLGEATKSWQASLLLGFGHRFNEAFPPATDSWRVDRPMLPKDQYRTVEQVKLTLAETAEQRGLRDHSNYDSTGYKARVLDNLLRTLSARHVPFLVVIVPQRSEGRSSLPPIARVTLLKILARHTNVEVLDLHDAVDDSGFFDHAHLTKDAQREITSTLIPRLQVQRSDEGVASAPVTARTAE